MRTKVFGFTLSAILLTACFAQAAPSLALSSPAKKIAVGESVALTVSFVVPSADTVPIANPIVKYTVPTGLTIQSATGPNLAVNTASVTWDGGSANSNTVSLRLVGATPISYTAVQGTVTIPMGDFAPGEGDVATITIKR